MRVLACVLTTTLPLLTLASAARADARFIRIEPGTYAKGTHSVATASVENGVRIWRLQNPQAAPGRQLAAASRAHRTRKTAPVFVPFFVPQLYLPALPFSAAEPHAQSRYVHSFDARPAPMHRRQHRQPGFGVR